MQEIKDSTIRLFGKNIQLPPNGQIPAIYGDDFLLPFFGTVVSHEDSNSVHDRTSMTMLTTAEEYKKESSVGVEAVEEDQEAYKDHLAGKHIENKQQDDALLLTNKASTMLETSLATNENPKTPSIDKEIATSKTHKPEKEPNEKSLKKPDKILPCPRCNSMDTKFCYHNNYNVNQPRHFCKNCQRYWTAGGSMRNVPVGAGRRRNKHASLHYRHITVSEALQAAQIDAQNGIHHPSLETNGRVLTFGSDAPRCESMSPVLNLAEQRVLNLNGTHNGFQKLEHRIPASCKGGENGDDHYSGSSVAVSSLTEGGGRNGPQDPMIQNLHGFPSQIPCLPGVPLRYPWNSAVPIPAFCHPGSPMPFHPAPYWTCTIPGAWNMPWLSPHSSCTNQKAPSSGPNPPTLGKHSRDGDMLEPSNTEEEEPPKQKNSERCISVTKTLRTNDPDEASRWAILGIKNDKADSFSGGLFKAFQSKGTDEKNHIAETSLVLLANPAALSRSLGFRETSQLCDI